MKQVFGLAIIIGLFVTSFSSCQKEIDWSLNSKTQVDSTILIKYIEFDTTLTPGLDTMTVGTFDYNNSGRLIGENIVTKDQNAPPTTTFPFFEKYTYLYNNNETLPYKVIVSHRSFLDDGYDTAYLFYMNGIVIRDSIRSRYIDALSNIYESIAVNLYTNNGNNTQITQYRTQTLNPPAWPPPCPGTMNYQKTYVNGNIISEVGNYTDCSGIGTSEANLVFDNRPNPAYPYRIPYPVLDGFLAGTQKNNPVESWSSVGIDWYKYSYTYRSDGYPLIVRAYEVTNPTNAWKGLYIYK
jgi:hypothetical protein